MLTRGLNHIEVLTHDLDRFIEFCKGVSGLEVVPPEATPQSRHAILRTGPVSWLHPAEVFGNEYGVASPGTFKRGHLDHLALAADSPFAFEALRERSVARCDTDGVIEVP